MARTLFTVPVSVWGNTVAPVLTLTDLLALRGTSTHFNTEVTTIISVYQHYLQWEVDCTTTDVVHMNTVGLVTSLMEQEQQIIGQLTRMDVAELMSYCNPPIGLHASGCMAVLLVFGRAEKDRWQRFRREHTDMLPRLREVSALNPNITQHLAEFEEYLRTYTQTKMSAISRFSALFYPMMEKIVEIGRVRSVEFDKKEVRRIYCAKEAANIGAFLQRRARL